MDELHPGHKLRRPSGPNGNTANKKQIALINFSAPSPVSESPCSLFEIVPKPSLAAHVAERERERERERVVC